MIHIEQFTFNPFQERTSVVWDDDRNCAFVDPGCADAAELGRLTEFIDKKGLTPVCVMLTHAHFDHIYGVAGLARTYGIPVFMHEGEQHTIDVTNPYMCRMFGFSEPEKFEWIPVQDCSTIEVGGLKFDTLETPGHTPGGVCFLERSEKVLFSGDTLFAGAIGRTDHPGGDYDQLMKSIFEKLLCLDGDVDVFPGHGPNTTITDERMTNPFLLPFNEPNDD